MKNNITLLSITSNDLGLNYGPSIHYLELWNEITKLEPCITVEGMYPSWIFEVPIIEPKFPCKPTRVRGRRIRQVAWDIRCGIKLLFQRNDIVYIRISSFHIFSLIALSLRGTPLCVEINGAAIPDGVSSSTPGIIRKISDYCERGLIRRSSVTFSVTKELATYAESVNPKAKHIHVENGVSSRFTSVMRAPSNNRNDPFECIYVGTYTAWDGATQIPEIARENPEVNFTMVGDGGLRREVEKNAPPNMKFLGWVPYPKLPELYASADCAIVLYERDRHVLLGSSPLKIREYLASRLPVFTTNSTGTEIIEDYGVGVRVSGADLGADFKEFMGSLHQYQQAFDSRYGDIMEGISWASTAKTTAACIIELFNSLRQHGR